MSNGKCLSTLWLTLSLGNDCCLPGAGCVISNIRRSRGLCDHFQNADISSASCFCHCPSSKSEALHCSAWKLLSSSESQALTFIQRVVSLPLFFYSFLAVYNIYLFGQLAYLQCQLFLLALLDGLQLSLTLSSMLFLFFPPCSITFWHSFI